MVVFSNLFIWKKIIYIISFVLCTITWLFKYFKKQQLMFQNNIICYSFRNSYENEIKNEVNSNQIESSFNEVEHDKNFDISKHSETSMLQSFLFSCHINNS